MTLNRIAVAVSGIAIVVLVLQPAEISDAGGPGGGSAGGGGTDPGGDRGADVGPSSRPSPNVNAGVERDRKIDVDRDKGHVPK